MIVYINYCAGSNEKVTYVFDDCEGTVVPGIQQGAFDDGDWICGYSTELITTSAEDHGKDPPPPFLSFPYCILY